MAFEGLTEKLSAAFKKLRGKGRLSEADVKEAMREIRLALLEADVNFKVVKQFVATVTERAIGADVLESLTPAQMIVKIVNEELTNLMGGESTKLTIASKPPTVVMMVGLQGAGKTTNCAKLAGLMKRKEGKRPLLAACDIYRPAAIQQLEVVGKQLDIPVFQMGQTDPVDIARAGIEGILPLERQAGVDLERLRQRYPRFLFLGHYDKMVMPKGEQAMREEFERLLPVMRQGGFLPSVDHQTPPGVSLENYRIYLKLNADGSYSYKKKDGSTLKFAVRGKWQRLPATLEFVRK